MHDSPAAIALASAKLLDADRILLVTPGPGGSQILAELTRDLPAHLLTALESSIDRLKALSGRIRRVRGQATRLPFKRHSFEAVLSFEALFSIRPPWTALAEFHRVLVPDGKLILFEPQSLGALSSLRDKISGPGKRVFPIDEIKFRLARADYVVELIESFGARNGLKLPSYCVRAIKKENPVEPVPQFLTANEMMARRKNANPKGEELP